MPEIKKRKFFTGLILILVLASFSLAFFHHHDDGEHSDCPVCALIYHGVCVLALMIVSAFCLDRAEGFLFKAEICLAFFSGFPFLQRRGPPLLS